MVISVRAIYHDGQLRPLDPLDLTEGQTVSLSIMPDGDEINLTMAEVDARLRSAGFLMELDLPADAVELTPEERERIGRLFVGDRPSESLIDEDRGLY
jgi:predicted DNA-binding antitoxin AbrB/MazE fold protein